MPAVPEHSPEQSKGANLISLEAPASADDPRFRFGDRALGGVIACKGCGKPVGPHFNFEQDHHDEGRWLVSVQWECECGTGTPAIQRVVRQGSASGKIIITGPGRAGTTFLLQLLTRLGFDTGYDDSDEMFDPEKRAGCEHLIAGVPIYAELTPRIIKSPEWCFEIPTFIEKWGLPVDHVIIPVREREKSIQSRLDVDLPWRIGRAAEGCKAEVQSMVHLAAIGSIFEAISLYEIPFTTLVFPRFIDDPTYCYSFLSCPFLMEPDDFDWPNYEKFLRIHQELARPESIKFR